MCCCGRGSRQRAGLTPWRWRRLCRCGGQVGGTIHVEAPSERGIAWPSGVAPRVWASPGPRKRELTMEGEGSTTHRGPTTDGAAVRVAHVVLCGQSGDYLDDGVEDTSSATSQRCRVAGRRA